MVKQQVDCTDVMGRPRSIGVIALQQGCVGVQVPPGEWFEINSRQLQDLLIAAREAARESRRNEAHEPGTIEAGD